MTSQTPERSSQSEIRYIAPAGEHFVSLQQQAVSFMDFYCENWRSDQTPESYMIPPIFNYTNPDVGDGAFNQGVKDKNCPDDIFKPRNEEEPNCVVFRAIEQLIQDKIQVPFIAVHKLDLRLSLKDGKLGGLLTEIFPNVPWAAVQKKFKSATSGNAEFDYVLVGPKIGFVVIEVKGATFAREGNTSKNEPERAHKHHMQKPERYWDGFAQLNAIEALILMLEECTEVSNNIPITKILCAPNLEKEIYQSYEDTLKAEPGNQKKLQLFNTAAGVTKLFKEDKANSPADVSKPALYNALRDVLEKRAPALPTHQKLYEAYAPIIAAIKSVTIRELGARIVDLDKYHMSELDAILKEARRISSHNVGKTPQKHATDQESIGEPKTSLAQCSEFVDLSKNSDKVTKSVIYLSRDQLSAFNGLARQIIFGAAGSGKTIVLQEKALELLEQGHSVLILAPKSIHKKYEDLLQGKGKYEIQTWSFEITNEIGVKSKCNRIQDTIFSISFDFFIVLPLMMDYILEKQHFPALEACTRLWLAELALRNRLDQPCTFFLFLFF